MMKVIPDSSEEMTVAFTTDSAMVEIGISAVPAMVVVDLIGMTFHFLLILMIRLLILFMRLFVGLFFPIVCISLSRR